MSEKLLLDSLLIALFERKVIDDKDLKKIVSVRDLILLLNAKGVLPRSVVEKDSKKLVSLVVEIKALYEKKQLTAEVVNKLRSQHNDLLNPFFDFVERNLL